jgi:hypothetical protein
MDISNEGQKVVFFVTEYGLISILEKMSCAIVSAVEVLGVPGKELSHYSGDSVFSALEKDMDMVVHEHPSID